MQLAAHLRDGSVHICQVNIDDPGWDRFSAVLSRAENEKAERFRTLKLRQNYLRCRSALRMLLALYAGQPANGIALSYGQFGKPEIADQKWHFNLSHSEDRALIAISSYPIGIDLECMDRAGVDIAELLNIVCHRNEITALAFLPQAERSKFFYQLWVQKEAYCKALGTGLQNKLCSLHFVALPSMSILQVRDEQTDNASLFFVHDLPCPTGYVASVCLPCADVRISVLEATPKDFGSLKFGVCGV
jgi:4'-phosphopantetheinyl transferase